MGGGGVAGSQPMSTGVQLRTWSPKKLWRSNSIFNLWATHRKTKKERQLAEGRVGGKGMSEEPNHTTAKKAWSTINHSILSAEKHLLFYSG
jgi:hypothetical protein